MGLTLALLLTSMSGLVHAQNCGAAGKEIRSVQSTAFDEYPASNDVKQGILLMLYGRGSADCPKALYSFAMVGKEFLTTFDEAYRLSLSNNTGDRLSAINLARTLEGKADIMQKNQGLGASALDVATSARTALADFFRNQGRINEREGGLANRTRDKIAHYRLATLAYEAADENILAANTKVKWETLEEKYGRDMEKANGLFSEAESHMKNTHVLSGSIPLKIKAYVDAMEAIELYQSALSYYIFHNEEEKILITKAKIAGAEKTMASLGRVLIFYFMVLAIFLVGTALYLLNRLLAWKEDNYEYYLGNELIKVRGVE
jgi:hypothetical protein